jgi:hypothetical protein
VASETHLTGVVEETNVEENIEASVDGADSGVAAGTQGPWNNWVAGDGRERTRTEVEEALLSGRFVVCGCGDEDFEVVED